jgi:PPOX class probable F420-dependent enzyme
MVHTNALPISSSTADRLAKEKVIWLTTVDGRGTPIPTPVWYLWTDGSFLLFSQPDTAKLANIAANPRVALHFNSDAHGGSVSVFTGEAHGDSVVPEDEWQRYVAKYARDIDSLELTPDSFRADYSVAIRVVPRRLRGW